MRQGEVGNDFFVTLQGSMSVHVDKSRNGRRRSRLSTHSSLPSAIDDELIRLGKCVAIIVRGDAFGEQALLEKGGGLRMSTVVTREMTELISIPKWAYNLVIENHGSGMIYAPSLCMAALKKASKHRSGTSHRMNVTNSSKATHKVRKTGVEVPGPI